MTISYSIFTKEPTYRELLKDIYVYMLSQFRLENENIIVLYYFALTCLLVKKLDHCLEALKLIRVIFELNFSQKKATVIEYYKTKSENIENLARTLKQQVHLF